MEHSMLSFEGFTQRLKDDNELEKVKTFTELYEKLANDFVQRGLFLLDSVSCYFNLANYKPETEKAKQWQKFMRSDWYEGSFTRKESHELR